MTDTPTTTAALDEMRVKAILSVMQRDASWNDPAVIARAIREADEAAGLVTVPNKLTADMHRAGNAEINAIEREAKALNVYGQPCAGYDVQNQRIWTAQLAASPFSRKDTP